METLSQEQIIGILIYQKTLKTGFTDQEQKMDIIVSGRIKQRKKKMYQSHRRLSFRPVPINLESKAPVQQVD